MATAASMLTGTTQFEVNEALGAYTVDPDSSGPLQIQVFTCKVSDRKAWGRNRGIETTPSYTSRSAGGPLEEDSWLEWEIPIKPRATLRFSDFKRVPMSRASCETWDHVSGCASLSSRWLGHDRGSESLSKQVYPHGDAAG
jgi:hypothetical protein